MSNIWNDREKALEEEYLLSRSHALSALWRGNAGYVQEVLYAGYAGRLYGRSRLITSGTCNPAITGDGAHRRSTDHRKDPQASPSLGPLPARPARPRPAKTWTGLLTVKSL